MSIEEVSELIGLIYQGPLEELPWATVLRRLSQRLDASWVVLVLRPAAPERPSLIIECHHQEVSISTADYTDFQRYSSDPFTGLPQEIITSPEEFLGAGEWFNSNFFREYLQPLDVYYQIGADFRSDRHSECRLRLCRSRATGDFNAADRRLCQLLVPHFKQAVYLHASLSTTDTERRLYASVFDRMQVGTVILDESGNALTVNQAAETLLAERDGLQLYRDALRARPLAQERALRTALNAVLADIETPQLRALSISRGGDRSALKLLIKTIPRWHPVAGSRRPAAVVYIRDPDRVFIPSADVLRMLFGFTPAESVLAKLLAEGLSLDQAVAHLGISKNTGKSRLRAIFAKTGVSRQSALVRLLLDTIVSL